MGCCVGVDVGLLVAVGVPGGIVRVSLGLITSVGTPSVGVGAAAGMT